MGLIRATKSIFSKLFGSDADQKKKDFRKNLPLLSKEARINLRKVVDLQTNDELIESLTRLDLEIPFIDEYMRTIEPFVRPISIRGVFDANERNGRGIAMVMLYMNFRLCKPAIDALGMTKRTIRLPDWDKKKFQYAEGDREKPTAILKIVYDIRIKKDF